MTAQTIASKNPVRFLLVEDDDDHAMLVMRNLRRSRVGNKVAHVRDGVDALAYVRREGEHSQTQSPDVILLDLNLPKLNGHEVLAAIRSDPKLEHLLVVVLTTSDADGDRLRAYRHHANSYVVKPLDFGQFRELLDDLSLYWGVWNRPSPQ